MTTATASLGPTLPVRLPVLADVLPGRRVRDVVLVLGAALLTALLAQVALPIAGLLAEGRATEVAAASAELKKAWAELGCTLPYMGFNLIPLSVIPEIRITDKGLVTVPGMAQPPLFETAD